MQKKQTKKRLQDQELVGLEKQRNQPTDKRQSLLSRITVPTSWTVHQCKSDSTGHQSKAFWFWSELNGHLLRLTKENPYSTIHHYKLNTWDLNLPSSSKIIYKNKQHPVSALRSRTERPETWRNSRLHVVLDVSCVRLFVIAGFLKLVVEDNINTRDHRWLAALIRDLGGCVATNQRIVDLPLFSGDHLRTQTWRISENFAWCNKVKRT